MQRKSHDTSRLGKLKECLDNAANLLSTEFHNEEEELESNLSELIRCMEESAAKEAELMKTNKDLRQQNNYLEEEMEKLNDALFPLGEFLNQDGRTEIVATRRDAED